MEFGTLSIVSLEVIVKARFTPTTPTPEIDSFFSQQGNNQFQQEKSWEHSLPGNP